MTTTERRLLRHLTRGLEREGVDHLTDDGSRAMYASDASLYRIPPMAVAMPRTSVEIARTIALCTDLEVPLTVRGAGTSVAGNAIGPGLVVDLRRHMNRVVDIDADAGTALVEPGVVHATLQARAQAAGWRFGPDPSTHSRCTIGGMIGSNACGARSLGYGRMSDNLNGVRAMLADGTEIATGDLEGPHTMERTQALEGDLREVMATGLATVRTEFDRFGRQVSGYALQHLLPERFDLTRAIVGSEGTLTVVTRASVRLVRQAASRALVVMGFDDIVSAAHATPDVVSHQPTACEGIDSRIVDVVRRHRGPAAVPDLPDGGAWLFVEFSGDDADEVLQRCRALVDERVCIDARIVTDPTVAARLWRIREDGAGLAGSAPSGRRAWAGWEDAAVPPAHLGAYLEEFDALVDSHGLTSAPFGHFGEGCVHVRLDFPFDRRDGRERFQRFLVDAADLVAVHGGTLSGEHGDGRARSELLPRMYSADSLRLFAAVKAVFDPRSLLNPGIVVDPDAVAANIRVAGEFPSRRRLAFAYPHDGGSLAAATHRCTGVGKCLADNSGAGEVMCPSYQATGQEKDSTRGRARVLQEVIRGERLDFGSRAVRDALDLCLACKGCTSDCPSGIDMPTYKSEVLHQTYRRRLRPRSHYTLGWLPRWARVATRAPRLANALVNIPVLRSLALATAGVDSRRAVPRFADAPFRARWAAKAAREQAVRSADGARSAPACAPLGPVLLFVDSFSEAFAPEVAMATAAVLEDAGFAPILPSRGACCGLTWISTGQLSGARRILTRTISELDEVSSRGIPIVGVEPSCTAVLRADAVDLLDTDAARRVAENTYTLAELIQRRAPGWTPTRDLEGATVLAQPHCHHRAVMGWDADARLLERAGASVVAVSGCCGLAGNFGVERGHYEVSVAVAGQNLLPAVDAASAGAVVAADGFSCRTQLADLRGLPALHLAQLLTSADVARHGSRASDGRGGP